MCIFHEEVEVGGVHKGSQFGRRAAARFVAIRGPSWPQQLRVDPQLEPSTPQTYVAMPRAAELARNRRERRRAALQAEREREQQGYTMSDTQLMRPTRDGHASVMAVQSRPLGTVDLTDPFNETGALRGRAIMDPTLAATAHLLTSTFRFEGDGWMSQVRFFSPFSLFPHFSLTSFGTRCCATPTCARSSRTRRWASGWAGTRSSRVPGERHSRLPRA